MADIGPFGSASSGLPDLQCAVCAQRGHGCHFGVVACRPCAAFFRRCIAENRSYKCLRGTNKCDIRKEGHRNACKACRLRLCRLAGMTFSSGQQDDKDSDRGQSGSPTQNNNGNNGQGGEKGGGGTSGGGGGSSGNKSKKEKYYNAVVADQLGPNASPLERQLLEETGAPTLAKIVRAHNAYISGQRSLFLAMHPEAAFQNYMMISARMEDNLQMYSGSKPLLFAMLNDGIEPFRLMDHQSKLLLLDESYRQISTLHNAHLTLAEFPHPDDRRYLLGYGHLMDNNQLDLIIGQWAESTTNAAEYIRIKKPLMEKAYKFMTIYKGFTEGVRQQDFCALIAITLWNIAQQQFGEIRAEWNDHKEAIFSEWLLDLNSRFGGGRTQNSALFMGQLLCTLVELNALTTSMEEASTLYRIFQPDALRTCPDAMVTKAVKTMPPPSSSSS